MPEATLLSCKFEGRVFISIQVIFVSEKGERYIMAKNLKSCYVF